MDVYTGSPFAFTAMVATPNTNAVPDLAPAPDMIAATPNINAAPDYLFPAPNTMVATPNMNAPLR